MDFGSVVGSVVLVSTGLAVITWKNCFFLRDAHPWLRLPVIFAGVALVFVALTIYDAIFDKRKTTPSGDCQNPVREQGHQEAEADEVRTKPRPHDSLNPRGQIPERPAEPADQSRCGEPEPETSDLLHASV